MSSKLKLYLIKKAYKMKKLILNIAAVTVIATTSFIACDKDKAKGNNDAASTTDSTATTTVVDESTTPEAAPATPDSAKVDAPKADEAKSDARVDAPAPKADEAKKAK